MASVYKKGGRWWLRFKGADGRWRGAPAKAKTKPAARLEALERERLARQQREGLAPSDDNRRRTFGELMNLWHERYGSRLRSQTIKLSVEKHLRPVLGNLLLGGAAAALPPLLNSKIGELSPSSLNHLRAYCHRLYAVASMRSVGWWMGPNPVNRLELPKFKEPRRKRPTVAAEDVPRVLAALSPEWRPLFATAFFLGLRRGELLALQKEDVDLRDWTITVRRSNDADVTKGGDDGTVPVPEPLRPYLDAAIKLSPSKWVFPAADGKQRAPDTNLKAVLRRALGRAGIVEGYDHRCRKPGCGHVELANDNANRRCPKDNRALWIRPLPKEYRLPLAAPHDGDAARAREGASVCCAEDPAPRRHRDYARHLHARRRHRGHARRGREARFRPARRARAGARGPAPKRRDLCYQFATGSLSPKR